MIELLDSLLSLLSMRAWRFVPEPEIRTVILVGEDEFDIFWDEILGVLE